MDSKIFDNVKDVFVKYDYSVSTASFAEIMLRVKITVSHSILQDDENLFEKMQEATSHDLGYFNCSPKMFSEIYAILKDEDIIEFLNVMAQDAEKTSSFIKTPKPIAEWVSDKLNGKDWNSMLIPISENYMCDLRTFAKNNENRTITVCTSYPLIKRLLELAYKDHNNVVVTQLNIYEQLNFERRFDLIFCIPTFGGRRLSDDDSFICRELDMIAAENLLSLLNADGKLLIVLPARVTFAAGRVEKFRRFVESRYCINEIRELPAGIFRYTGVRTFYFEFSKDKQSEILISTYDIIGNRKVRDVNIECKGTTTISKEALLERGDWSISHLFDNRSALLQSYFNSSTKKVKIKEIAEVFRGKAVKSQINDGNVSVINISNISSNGIDYAHLDSFEEEERKVKRYELQTGDVLLTCRGTAIKAAVFEQQEKICIPAVSLVVIRPNDKIASEFIKIFFETTLGKEVLKSCSVGEYALQMTHNDVMEISIPMLDKDKQLEIVEQYKKEKTEYQQLIESAENRWNKALEDITDKMI